MSPGVKQTPRMEESEITRPMPPMDEPSPKPPVSAPEEDPSPSSSGVDAGYEIEDVHRSQGGTVEIASRRWCSQLLTGRPAPIHLEKD